DAQAVRAERRPVFVARRVELRELCADDEGIRGRRPRRSEQIEPGRAVVDGEDGGELVRREPGRDDVPRVEARHQDGGLEQFRLVACGRREARGSRYGVGATERPGALAEIVARIQTSGRAEDEERTDRTAAKKFEHARASIRAGACPSWIGATSLITA